MYEELIVYVEHIGGVVVITVMPEMTSQLQGELCKLAESCKTEKLLFAIALPVLQLSASLHNSLCNCDFISDITVVTTLPPIYY